MPVVCAGHRLPPPRNQPDAPLLHCGWGQALAVGGLVPRRGRSLAHCPSRNSPRGPRSMSPAQRTVAWGSPSSHISAMPALGRVSAIQHGSQQPRWLSCS